jgi:hypothetical protein
LPNNSFKPITNTAWVRARLFKLQKNYQLLAHGRWFSPGNIVAVSFIDGENGAPEEIQKPAASH